MFDRTPNLNGSQIINYRASPDGKWLVLIGIAPGAPEARHAIGRSARLVSAALRRRRTRRTARCHGR
jgi:clathrin heavy chain